MKLTDLLPEDFIWTIKFISIKENEEIWNFKIKEVIKDMPIYIFLFQLLIDIYKDEEKIELERLIFLVSEHEQLLWKEETEKLIEKMFKDKISVELIK